MAETVNTREIALNILLEVTRDGRAMSQVMADWLLKYQYLDKKDRSFISRLVRATLENMIFIDEVIDHYASVRTNKMKPVVRTILRMGVCQMLYMDGVPDHAVVNESVSLAVRKGFKGLRGFVNGVLRTAARNKAQVNGLIPDKEENPEGYLSLRYSAPSWLVDLWTKAYGFEKTETMLGAMGSERMTTIRVNTLKTTAQKLRAQLEAEGVTVTAGAYVPCVMKISGYDHLAALESFQKGFFMVQDESSVLAGLCAGFTPGMKVLDLCGAPGGKSMNAAFLMEDQGEIICRDVSGSKIDKIKMNAQRLGITCVTAQQADAAVMDEALENDADVVIADVPCSGLGVIGRKTDIKYHMTPEAITSLVALQRRILDQAWRYVRPGGVLIYSTCTVNPEENEKQVAYMTEKYPLVTETLAPLLPEGLKSETSGTGYIQLMPGIHQCDGFFAARLRRKN